MDELELSTRIANMARSKPDTPVIVIAMEQIDNLKRLNGELCAEVNEKDRRIRELERAAERDADVMEALNLRSDELEALVREYMVHFCNLSSVLFMERGKQVRIDPDRVARLKTDEMRLRLRAGELGIEV